MMSSSSAMALLAVPQLQRRLEVESQSQHPDVLSVGLSIRRTSSWSFDKKQQTKESCHRNGAGWELVSLCDTMDALL